MKTLKEQIAVWVSGKTKPTRKMESCGFCIDREPTDHDGRAP